MNASEMVILIEEALRLHPVGIVYVMVDGQQVSYNRKDAREELEYWRRRAAKETGKNPITAGINLGRAW